MKLKCKDLKDFLVIGQQFQSNNKQFVNVTRSYELWSDELLCISSQSADWCNNKTKKNRGAKCGKIKLLVCRKVNLKLLQVSGATDSRDFHKNIQNYIRAFQMTLLMLRLFMTEDLCRYLMYRGKCVTVLDIHWHYPGRVSIFSTLFCVRFDSTV